jgi:glycosyltransferase involved in cell wall biosynthesis
MIVLFAHDGYVSQNGAAIYSGAFDAKLVERYRNIAENVVLLVRAWPYNPAGYGKREVQQADYIIARMPSNLGYLAAKYGRKYRKRYMVEVVGCPWDSLRQHSLCGKIYAPLGYWQQKQTVRQAAYAHYVTKTFLQKRYPCRGTTLACSDVEIRDWDETVLAGRIAKIKITDPRRLVLGTLGAIHMKYKGYDTVIRALAQLNREGYAYRYLIAGSGDPAWLNQVIQQYQAERFVTIVPPMPHEQVFEWLDTLDVYLQPSQTEGLPRALLEAMSRACPCIGSDAGGIPELLPKESIFTRNNYWQLAEVLEFNQTRLSSLAETSFNTVKTYRRELLYEQKMAFYKMFANQARCIAE